MGGFFARSDLLLEKERRRRREEDEDRNSAVSPSPSSGFAIKEGKKGETEARESEATATATAIRGLCNNVRRQSQLSGPLFSGFSFLFVVPWIACCCIAVIDHGWKSRVPETRSDLRVLVPFLCLDFLLIAFLPAHSDLTARSCVTARSESFLR